MEIDDVRIFSKRERWQDEKGKRYIEKLFSKFDIEEGDLKEYEKDGQTTSSNPKR